MRSQLFAPALKLVAGGISHGYLTERFIGSFLKFVWPPPCLQRYSKLVLLGLSIGPPWLLGKFPVQLINFQVLCWSVTRAKTIPPWDTSWPRNWCCPRYTRLWAKGASHNNMMLNSSNQSSSCLREGNLCSPRSTLSMIELSNSKTNKWWRRRPN